MNNFITGFKLTMLLLIFFNASFVVNILAFLMIIIGGRIYLSKLFLKMVRLPIRLFTSLASSFNIFHIQGTSSTNQSNRQQGKLIIANHPSWVDAIVLLNQQENLACFYKPKWYFTPFFCFSSYLMGNISVKSSPIKSIKTAIQIINKGKTLLVFPEGSRSKNLYKTDDFKSGFALIAEKTTQEVEPICIVTSTGLLGAESKNFSLSSLPVSYNVHTLDSIKLANFSSKSEFSNHVRTIIDRKLEEIEHEQKRA